MNDKQFSVGQDSFLDIIANLVGILIILVIVVGAQAKSAWTKKEHNPDMWSEVQELTEDVLRKSNEAQSLRQENGEFETKIAQQAGLMLELDQQRHEMLVQVAFVKREIDLKKQGKSEKEQLRVTAKLNLEKLQKRYESVAKRVNEASEDLANPKIETIEHFPTPIARTVFSDEVHFLLSKGRVSYIPMDELLGLMRSEWRDKGRRLLVADKTMETVGPINGFRLQYHLISEVVPVETTHVGGPRRQARFDHFEMLPVSALGGELVHKALRNGSELSRRLQRFVPAKTTVSIWIYPDSYRELEGLKNKLRDEGFQIASWPLQFGKLVSGGPSGFRSSAQ